MRPDRKKPERSYDGDKRDPGAWISWNAIEQLLKIRLRTGSRWQVLLAVVMTWFRYGQITARLSISDISLKTGLSQRTVNNALAELFAFGVIRRTSRYRHFTVELSNVTKLIDPQNPAALSRVRDEEVAGEAILVARPLGNHVCASPTTTYVSVSNKKSSVQRKGTFTPRQQDVINDVLKEVSDLLGSPAADLTLPPKVATKLGLPVGTSYGMAMGLIEASDDRQSAGKFVRAMIELRSDPKIQGLELPSGASS